MFGRIISPRKLSVLSLVLVTHAGSVLAAADLNRKAPPALTCRAPERIVAKTINPPSIFGSEPVTVDPHSDVSDLPFLKIEGYDLKIAFAPSVLMQFGLKSGESVPAELLYSVIAAERALGEARLK